MMLNRDHENGTETAEDLILIKRLLVAINAVSLCTAFDQMQGSDNYWHISHNFKAIDGMSRNAT